MTNDHKLAKRAHKLGYRYITRWPVPTIGTEHILEHKDGDRHFRSMDEVERFIGEQEIAKLEDKPIDGARSPAKTAGKKRTRPERVADAAASDMKLRLEKGFTPEAMGFQQMTAEDLANDGRRIDQAGMVVLTRQRNVRHDA